MIIQTPKVNLTGTDPAELGWHRETSFLQSYPPKGPANVFVIGAYSGTIAALLVEQLPEAEHFLFEPQDWAAAELQEMFGETSNAGVYPYALGDRTGIFRMGLYTSYDCTFMRSDSIPFKDLPGVWYDAQMMEFGHFMATEHLASIYYASVNIEGYEYVLLPHMARMGWLAKTQLIGISWHDARFKCPVPGPYRWQGEPVITYEEAQRLLRKTHKLILEIDNWQSWERKSKK